MKYKCIIARCKSSNTTCIIVRYRWRAAVMNHVIYYLAVQVYMAHCQIKEKEREREKQNKKERKLMCKEIWTLPRHIIKLFLFSKNSWIAVVAI